MIRFEPGPDRWKLGFKEAVLGNFEFLRKYGFRLARAEVTFVRYEMPWYSFKRRFYANVYHSRGGYELGFETGPCDNDRQMVNLPWILRWAGYAEADKYFGEKTALCTHTKEGVQALVPKMAELVREYAEPFLRRDPDAYASLNGMVEEANAAFQARMDRLWEARHAARPAWQAKDYARVVALYEPLVDDLTEGEKAKLAEAKKQLEARTTTAAKPNHGNE